MAFNAIVELFKLLQPIKSKYPMVVSHGKHLEKCRGNEQQESREVAQFKAWLLENPDVPKLSNPFYKSSKTTICFSNVYASDSALVVQFEQKLVEIEQLLFPSGRPQPEPAGAVAATESPGVAAAMAEIEKNPVFSGLLESIKATVADTDVLNDPSQVLENKNFKTLLKSIQSGIKTGQFKITDLTSTIHNVIGSVRSELDPEVNSVLGKAVEIMNDAEQGKQPDIGEIMGLLKSLNTSQ